MTRIGDERETARMETSRELHYDEEERRCERPPENGTAAVVVMLPVIVSVCVHAFAFYS